MRPRQHQYSEDVLRARSHCLETSHQRLLDNDKRIILKWRSKMLL